MAARAAKPSASEASKLHVSLKAAITWRTGDERLRQGVGAAPGECGGGGGEPGAACSGWNGLFDV